MQDDKTEIFAGNAPLHRRQAAVSGEYVQLFGEPYYVIRNYDQMPPFFMSLVSGGDHWLFISSSGGLTAGRRNPDSALFPYETEDKVTAHSEETGSKSILRVSQDGRTQLWEPFSERYAGIYRCERNLYKNVTGNKLLFEEINRDLQLTFRCSWRTGDRFGFIKSSRLSNERDQACEVAILDGFQNLMPYGATLALQNSFSSLLDAYKRNELDPATGLGIFGLSATLTDRAEPSESLQATVAWQVGLEDVHHLLSAAQLDQFRYGEALTPERDLRATAGAYFVQADVQLEPGASQHWHIVADVNRDGAAVVKLRQMLKGDQAEIEAKIEEDIVRNTENLTGYVAAADGYQHSASETVAPHHFANVLFNIMRGGIFAEGYQVSKQDMVAFVKGRNRLVLDHYSAWFADLPDSFTIQNLYEWAASADSSDLVRLCYEYLPLTFSRRHGDPSRPWNQFSINLTDAAGEPLLDYQGNWRDIFQNWEPLALSYPGYIMGIIAKFLNATTADGYNPYRVTRAGIEWEVPEPDNPWSNIGYWSDHQIIYLLKLLELAEQVEPEALSAFWNRAIFAYAHVPYRLRPYSEMLADWEDTIVFDWETQEAIAEATDQLGTDARLHRDAAGDVIHVTMQEKLLTLLLAKVTNLVPEGGIWMNTQRPEWNDANNALVGKGLSVVTAAYLRRLVAFWQTQLAREDEESTYTVNSDVADFYEATSQVLADYHAHLESGFDDETRRLFMDAMGDVASRYRDSLYADGVSARRTEVSREALGSFLAQVQAYIEQTLWLNRRDDGLYHAYLIMRLDSGQITIEDLYPMLEGQVAILSSGLLTAEEVLNLLHSLRRSPLYRADQQSYILYPDRELPGFLQKNRISADQVANSALVAALDEAGDRRLLIRDDMGDYHFSGTFRNAKDVKDALDRLGQEEPFAEAVANERAFMLDLFESTFHHAAFTGRSGTFFAFEGLGSIYWHMVAKLLLAVQECYRTAVEEQVDSSTVNALAAAYFDIRSGLGFNKSPAVYGAFPTDPYSHTPANSGARQPGMTGQVKEEILTRWGELGLSIREGQLHFEPMLLHSEEFFLSPDSFSYLDTSGQRHTLPLPADSLAFTFCQTAIVYAKGDEPTIVVTYADGQTQTVPGAYLDTSTSRHIFDRDGVVQSVQVTIAH